MTRASKKSFQVRNLGEPLKLSKMDLLGIAAEPALAGENAKICTRLTMTSDDPTFHTIAESLTGAIEHRVALDNIEADLRRASTVVLVIKPDDTADLWIDAAAVSLDVMAKRAVKAGSPVFEQDIADVVGMHFPAIGLTDQDRIICIFRVGWRFALLFDLHRARPLDLAALRRDLGTMFRMLRYRNVYDAVANPKVFERLINAGWFPFVEILGVEFRELVQACEAGWDLAETERKILANFSSKRLTHMFKRWMGRPHFAEKKEILKAAISAFRRKDAVGTIKIALTEIEGVLREAHKRKTGKAEKLKKLLSFAEQSAEEKAGSPNTLLFPQAFGQYLAEYAFANFDPNQSAASAASRHAVGHGAAESDTYTQVRALQALLTLDQLAFYT